MNRRSGRPGEALIFAVGMVVFALCAHREVLLLPRMAGLLTAALALARGIAQSPQPWRLLGVTGFAKYRLIYIPLAVGLGIGLPTRTHSDLPSGPKRCLEPG